MISYKIRAPKKAAAPTNRYIAKGGIETLRCKYNAQAELAEKIHVTDKAVSRWERGGSLR